ncbi:MAG: methylenetetrahydrofolate reductase [Candidatus Wallbacteria bacterium]|nr:methylenetetrahydrofolate reductase [Candidatus Wallbacteria bacterium]
MDFRTLLNNGFVLTAELNPPRGVDVEPILGRIAPLARAFDGFAVTDDSLARLRMNAMAFAHLVHARLDVEMLMHLTCRDMSILKLHDYLLGTWALGIKNVLCMTGDPPRIGSFKESKGVYQLNSFQLLDLVRSVNRGVLQNGEKLSTKPDFFLGCVANPYSLNIKVEAKRLQKKFDSGAKYVITQPIYTRRTLEQFLEATADIPMKKLIGVLPLRGLANAHVIADSVPDIYMPADIFARLTKNDSAEEGIRLAREFIADVKGHVDGIHIFPLNHFDALNAILHEFPERLALVATPSPAASDRSGVKPEPQTAPQETASKPGRLRGNGRERLRD